MTRTCKTCEHFRPVDIEVWGNCHRRAPIAGPDGHALWPLTRPHEGCGEWRWPTDEHGSLIPEHPRAGCFHEPGENWCENCR